MPGLSRKPLKYPVIIVFWAEGSAWPVPRRQRSRPIFRTLGAFWTPAHYGMGAGIGRRTC